MSTRVIHNARIVLANETVKGQVRIEDGRITAIDAVAGLVPWLESGTRTSVRAVSPRSR